MSKNKIKVSISPKKNLNTTDISKGNRQFVISYKYLCLDNKKYSFDELTDNRIAKQHFIDFYEKVIEYSQLEDFKKKISSDKAYSKKNHIHPINWKDPQIRENSFSCLDSNLMEQIKEDCWQLGINNQGFRMHGFFIENIYYVVWLDPLHNLYDRK